MTKDERQDIAITNWKFSSKCFAIKNGYGIIVCPTGFGKTRIGVKICKLYLTNKEEKNYKIVIAVPNDEIKSNWINELNSYTFKDNIEILTFNKILENNIRKDVNLLIIDEIHECYSEKKQDIIFGKYINYTHFLGLTATPKDNQKRYIEILKYIPIIDEITEKEAIENKWIANFIEFNLAVIMNENDKFQYNYLTEQFQKFKSKFSDIKLADKCLSGGFDNKGIYYSSEMWCEAIAKKNGWKSTLDLNSPDEKEINDLWNPKIIKGYASNLYDFIRKRMNFIYNNDSKLNVALEILKKFEDRKIISFSQSTDFADKLCYNINKFYNLKDIENNLFENSIDHCIAYHSNLKTKMLPNDKGKLIKYGKTRLKNRAIENIKTGKSRIISTASALDKGFDVSDITVALICSRTQSEAQKIQRGGRAKRLDNTNNIVFIINLYLEDTQDENWLRKSQENSETNVYYINSIDEINYEPKNNNKIKISW